MFGASRPKTASVLFFSIDNLILEKWLSACTANGPGFWGIGKNI